MDDAAGTHASTLDASMARARTITLIMAHNAAFRGFYLEPGSRASKLRRGSRYVDGANDALVYLESLFPSQIGELCFIDRSGSENARVVHGKRAPVSDLSPDEAEQPVLRPDVRPAPRAGLPVPAVRVARHARLGRRQRHADPAGSAAALGGDRPLRAVGRELPARAARRRRRLRHRPGGRSHRPRDRRQLAPPAGRGAARRARRPPLRGRGEAPGRTRRDDRRRPRRGLSAPCPAPAATPTTGSSSPSPAPPLPASSATSVRPR